jgi:ComF family protein
VTPSSLPVRVAGRVAVRVAGRLLDLAFPAACAGCGAEGDVLCAVCLPALHARRGAPPGIPLGLPSTVPLPLLQLEWCAPYAGVVRSSLHALKYAGERRLAGPLGTAIAARWAEAGAGGELLVPVPIHAERRRRRGYDQAVLLANAAAASLRLPAVVALARVRPTHPQFELGRERRAENVADAFRVQDASRALVAGRWIVLVDDVATTGATLVACAHALLAAGASGVSACAVAREA